MTAGTDGAIEATHYAVDTFAFSGPRDLSLLVTQPDSDLERRTVVASTGAGDAMMQRPLGKMPGAVATRRMPVLRVNADATIRRHYLTKIMDDLDKAAACAGTLDVAPYAASMLRVMLEMADNSSDNYSRIVLALHDALAYRGAWARASSEQLRGAYRIMERYKSDYSLDETKIRKAVGLLSDLGLNVLPIELEWISDTDSDDVE